VSEYQYYEFRAIDRTLSGREVAALRRASTRAEITPASFVNFYEWGDLKAEPSVWMEKYFDAFLYLANWGTHQLMLRFPKRSLDLETARRYCPGGPAEARARGEFVILELTSEDDEADWESDGNGLLSPIIPARAAILAGDHRALYLAWLLAVQAGDVDEDAPEPPCPPGLGRLTAPLRAFADFLRIRDDLIEGAARPAAGRRVRKVRRSVR
jgi:hypothetical protein